MAYIWFREGDYEYSNRLYPANNPETGGTIVAVRVASEIRETVESLSSIPSTVTYEGVTYTVKYLIATYPADGTPYGTFPGGGAVVSTFYRCRALKQVPALPATIDYTNINYLYESCRSLTSVPTLPSGVVNMQSTYTYCSGIETFPTIPSTVTNLSYCFRGCSKMQTAPTLPPALPSLYYTFADCSELTTAPEIPASVTSCNYTFYNCTNLSGNVVVNNTPTSYTNAFKNTVNDIYIVNGGTAGSVWKDTIAPSYSNVHYEADDHPAPSLSSLTAIRVASNGSTTPAERGLWAYLTAQVGISTDLLPVGWTSEYSSTSVEIDGTTITPTWTASASTGTITLTAWVNINDLSAHTFAVAVTEDIKEGATTKATATSATLTTTLPKSYALVDYYHDPVTGTEGFAIGKYAEHADLFDVAMPSLFEDTLTAQDMTAQEVDDFVDSLVVGGGGTAVDLVVEQGTSGIWTYRKWSSGIAECWGTQIAHPNFSSAYGSIYIASTFPFTFPSGLFINTPTVNGLIDLKGGVGGVTASGVSNAGFSLYAYNATIYNATGQDILLMLSAKGKWK